MKLRTISVLVVLMTPYFGFAQGEMETMGVSYFGSKDQPKKGVPDPKKAPAKSAIPGLQKFPGEGDSPTFVFKIKHQLKAEGWIQNTVFSQDGTLIAAAHAKGVTIWNAKSGEQKHHFDGKYAHSIAFSPDGSHLAADIMRTIKVFDVASGRELFDGGKIGVASGVAYRPDGKEIILAYSSVKILDAKDGKLLRDYGGPDDERAGMVALSPDGKIIAAADGRITLMRADTGEKIATVKGGSSAWLGGLSFNHDGTRIASSVAGGIWIWDTKTGKEVQTIPIRTSFCRITPSPDGKWWAVGLYGIVSIRDTGTGKELAALKTGNSGTPAYGVKINPKGTLLAVGAGHRVQVWEIITQKSPPDESKTEKKTPTDK